MSEELKAMPNADGISVDPPDSAPGDNDPGPPKG